MSVRETSHEQVSFITYEKDFDAIIGPEPKVWLLADATKSGLPLYHEACIYVAETRSVFVTSNQLAEEPNATNNYTSDKRVKLFRIYDDLSLKDSVPELVEPGARAEEIKSATIDGAMLNGGVNLDPSTLLFCAQGTQNLGDPAGLLLLKIPDSMGSDIITEVILKDFYGIPFNSPNDVIIHPKDGSIWFTDPCYGYHKGIRPQLRLPDQVYRFDPHTKAARAVADGFTRPNGLCFSPDLQTLYITDTGAIHGSDSVPVDHNRPSHVYAFDVTYPRVGEPSKQQSQRTQPFLTNRRVFAYAPGRFPDGIKCDTVGNVYAGCGDGIEVWNDSGVLLGVVKVDGGVANFCFGEKGVIYTCNETRFWKIHLNGENVKGTLLGI